MAISASSLAPSVGREMSETTLPIWQSRALQILFSTSGRAHGWKSIEELVLPCSINTRFCRQNCGGLCVLVASRVIRNQICSFDSPFFVRVQNKLSFVKVLPGCGRCLFM